MDACLDATTWHHMTFIRTAGGDFYRLWFEDILMVQRLFGDEAEYFEPLTELRNRASVDEQTLPAKEG